MSDFLKFIADNANNADIGNSFIKELSSGTSRMELQAWFKERGYDLTLQECQELIDKKKNIIKTGDTVKGY